MAMMDRQSIAIIPGAREVTRSRDTEYPFRQNSDLFYLTGFEEPDAVLVLVPGRRQGQVVLFCRERDPEMEICPTPSSWYLRRIRRMATLLMVVVLPQLSSAIPLVAQGPVVGERRGVSAAGFRLPGTFEQNRQWPQQQLRQPWETRM